MSDQSPNPDSVDAAESQGAAMPHDQQIDQGAYQILRNRLDAAGKELRERIGKLNAARKDVFGGIETKLLGSDRITTPHNCVPRDMAPIGDRFLFGYNVHFGLKREIELNDVFALQRFDGETFHEESLDSLRDERFIREFKDLYRFYKNAVFAKFFINGPYLYMKFHVGRDVNDFKAFKWAVDQSTGELTYIDNRSDHEIRYPDQHQFDWQRVTRDMLRTGAYPHYSIEDKVYVETTGGTLTLKIEDNTDVGQGIIDEPVDDPDQGPDDADIAYAIQGHLVVLRIKPYQEDDFRYFIFNEKLGEAIRLDAIAGSCLILPDDHGLIFSNGYYLASGETQLFPNVPANMIFEKRIASPNGEDYLYVFYNRRQGTYTLLSYNVIEQKILTPTICSGFSIFDDGKMIYFLSHEEQQKHHAIQIWQTPYVGHDYEVPRETDSELYKIGNRAIVRGMAESSQLLQLIDRENLYSDLYVDIVNVASGLIDSYHWLGEADCYNLAEVVRQIRSTAQSAVAEYDKVVRIRKATANEISAVATETDDLIRENATRIYDNIEPFVKSLSGLRSIRGRIIALRELKYADLPRIDALEAEVEEQTDVFSRRTVEFLLKPDSLVPYDQTADGLSGRISDLEKVTEAKELGEEIDEAAGELEMLIDIVSNLKIDDATQRTTIIDGISAIFSKINAARTTLRNRSQQLGRDEGIAEFNSQLKLLNQSVVNYLDLCDTPEKTDEYLTKMMVQVEELEGRFAEFDEFVVELAEKRDEIYSAFESRKLQLIEKRNRRAQSLGQAADRILSGIRTRVGNMDSVNEIAGYFAGDLMIDKVRDIVEELAELDDTVRVDDIQSRMKTIREDTVRQLKDRQDLQADGRNTIRFGKHVFSINTQPIDLTTIVRDDAMHLHLTGTRFLEQIKDEAFAGTRDVWNQEVISESDRVYRAEYLAYLMHDELAALNAGERAKLLEPESDALLKRVQQFMGPRYDEGYTKGVHDVDAAAILKPLVELSGSIGLLRYQSDARALATMFWETFDDTPRKELLAAQIAGVGEAARLFAKAAERSRYVRELSTLLAAFAEEYPAFAQIDLDEAAEYLFSELSTAGGAFVLSPEAARLHKSFEDHLRSHRSVKRFRRAVDDLADHPMRRYLQIRDWIGAFVGATAGGCSDGDASAAAASRDARFVDEAAASLFAGELDEARIVDVEVRRTIDGLIGSHKVITDGRIEFDYNAFMARLNRFASERVPMFEQFTRMKKQFVDEAREDMRLEEFTPRVLTSFVRNKLIDGVFLPLIGDNFAKQMGTAGESKRTDRMGLLLLISPPGYGKTTLMEYIANRLGIVFMKINGPALGHSVTSLDPAEAPNASAREEIEKLNLAFEMGDNVMIYVDDIQHTHSEFLQKFISLCDAQRRVEGVYKGRTRTYDLRGRKVAVVMAGNPYTESGEKFQIPDMLANRADTYNLGDIIGDHGDAFKTSYLENCLTSNPTLNELASRTQDDVYSIIKIARTDSREGVEFESNLSTDQINEMVSVMKKLIQVRDVILTVNLEYIRSAGMEDQYRTEPAFQLQGSYRNMNRIAERVLPVMNDRELRTLIMSSYEQDAQTLTTGAEANLLKFKEMMGWITPAEQERWDEIRKTFARNNEIAAMGGDKTAAVVAQLSKFNDGLSGIGQAIATATSNGHAKTLKAAFDDKTLAAMSGLIDRLGAFEQSLRAAAVEEEPADDRPISAAFDEKTIAAMSGLIERMDKLQAEMAHEREQRAAEAEKTPQAAAHHPAAPPPSPEQITGQASPYEIRVTNKVPETFLWVLKEQFVLMKGWLEPLTQITASQEEKINKIGDSIGQLLGQYDKIIGQLENSRDDIEEADDG